MKKTWKIGKGNQALVAAEYDWHPVWKQQETKLIVRTYYAINSQGQLERPGVFGVNKRLNKASRKGWVCGAGPDVLRRKTCANKVE